MKLMNLFKVDERHVQPFIELARQHFPNYSQEVVWRVLAILFEQLRVERGQLVPNARLVADLKADDLDPIEIVKAIETEFRIAIPRHDAEAFVTISDLVQYVEEKRAQQCDISNPHSPLAQGANGRCL